MNKNKQTNLNHLLILCIVLSFAVGSLAIIIEHHHRHIDSETSSDKIVIPEGADDELPNQKHFISGWDRCLDQLGIDSDVVFLGDSITYKSNFFLDFPDLVICNLGVCSDTIKAVNYRVGTLETLKPEHVVLMIGINSLRNIDVNECIEDYRILVDNVLSRWDFELYIMSVTPISKNESGEDAPPPENIVAFNKAIAEIAQEKGATYVDLYSQVVDDSGYIKDIYTEDGLHLSDEAYEVWTEMIRPYIG